MPFLVTESLWNIQLSLTTCFSHIVPPSPSIHGPSTISQNHLLILFFLNTSLFFYLSTFPQAKLPHLITCFLYSSFLFSPICVPWDRPSCGPSVPHSYQLPWQFSPSSFCTSFIYICSVLQYTHALVSNVFSHTP